MCGVDILKKSLELQISKTTEQLEFFRAILIKFFLQILQIGTECGGTIVHMFLMMSIPIVFAGAFLATVPTLPCVL